MSDSTGALQKAQEIYIDSIQGRIGKFKATFEKLSTTITTSALIKDTISSGTAVISVLTKILSLGDGMVAKIVLITGVLKLLDLLSVGKTLPLMPEMVGVHTFVNCWENYERCCNYKVA